MPYPPSKGPLSAMSVALTSLNRPQGTSRAPQLEYIVPQAYQAPFAPPLGPTSQQKTTEPTRLLDLTKYRLYDDLATAVQRLPCRTPDFRRHTFFGRGLQGFGGWSMVSLAGRGDVGLKSKASRAWVAASLS